jgi:Ca2+-binding RTX toxin-like protein
MAFTIQHGAYVGTEGPDVFAKHLNSVEVYGKGGSDTLNGSENADRLDGQEGPDVIHGWGGFDTIWGGPDRDNLFGDAGNDDIFCGPGADVAHGGTGADHLSGNQGNDTLYGEAGKDTISGGGGINVVYGGADTDAFTFNPSFEATPGQKNLTTIADFQPNEDAIHFFGDHLNITHGLDPARGGDVLRADDGVGHVQEVVVYGHTDDQVWHNVYFNNAHADLLFA